MKIYARNSDKNDYTRFLGKNVWVLWHVAMTSGKHQFDGYWWYKFKEIPNWADLDKEPVVICDFIEGADMMDITDIHDVTIFEDDICYPDSYDIFEPVEPLSTLTDMDIEGLITRRR